MAQINTKKNERAILEIKSSSCLAGSNSLARGEKRTAEPLGYRATGTRNKQKKERLEREVASLKGFKFHANYAVLRLPNGHPSTAQDDTPDARLRQP